jgi:ATP-dependent Clp protease ATP-binding subunit ClpC
MFERFTDQAREVVKLAEQEARMLSHAYIGSEHLLLGLINEGSGIAAQVLNSLGATLDAARPHVVEMVRPGQEPPDTQRLPFLPEAQSALDMSLREAVQLGHNHVDTEHLLLALVRQGEGRAAQVLVNLGADPGWVRQRVIELLHERGDDRARLRHAVLRSSVEGRPREA